MDDKNLSGEEKRKLLKEQFKKELLQQKEFLNKVKNLRQQSKINKALNEMNVEDDTQDWVDKLNEETAFNEAKIEMALGAEENPNLPTEEQSEEDLRKIVAEGLVEQMKAELAEEKKVSQLGSYLTEEEEGEKPEDTPPKKTLGDIER